MMFINIAYKYNTSRLVSILLYLCLFSNCNLYSFKFINPQIYSHIIVKKLVVFMKHI